MRGRCGWLGAVVVMSSITVSLPGAQGQTSSCGIDVNCEIENGYYRALPPPDWDGVSPLPLVVYYSGWGGTPEKVLRNRPMINAAHARGALFVAPYAPGGYWRQIGEGRAEYGRDELAYVHALMDDLKARYPIDETRTLATGFSRGASMVWNIACYAGDLFTAYAPIAGGFWRSTPQDCPTGPVNLRHIHGTADTVVAYDEIGIYNSMPIPEGLDVLTRIAQCTDQPVAVSTPTDRYACQAWTTCTTGATIEICLHERGHSIPAEWVSHGFDWMVSLQDD